MSALPRLRESAAAMPAHDGEFAFDRADFERVRRLIHRHAGISLHEGKRAMVYSRLVRRLRELGHDSFERYLNQLESGPADAPEWQQFVNCLTTNLTAFFREEHHFPLLAAELAKRRDDKLRLWCNAASTGEEPYSLAITIAEALGPHAHRARLLATDIDTNVLDTAARGVYDIDARGLDAARRKRWFERGTGRQEGAMRVKPELRQLIEFRAFNLMQERWAFGEPFDIVFCRNVMIYFDEPTQRRVLERMHRALRPGGLLFAGHSENFTDAKDLFRLRGKTVYERA